MQEIKCPNCGEVFQVDESGYAQIAQQVRDKEFEKELSRRQQDMDAKRTSDLDVYKRQTFCVFDVPLVLNKNRSHCWSRGNHPLG